MNRTTFFRVANRRRDVVLDAWPAAVLIALSCAGCRLLGNQSATTTSVAACRDLSQQGICAIEQDQWEQAEQALSKAVETDPGDVQARRYYAETLWHRGAHDEAIEELSVALLDGGDAAAIVRVGEMLMAVGKIERAGKRADEALNQDPTLPSAWALRARVGRIRGEFDRALADFHRALDFAPNQADVLLDVIELNVRQNRPHRALAALQHLLDQAVPSDQRSKALYHQGLAYLQLQRHAEAADCFEFASRLDASNAELLYQLGKARLSLGETQAARDALRRAVAVDPKHSASAALLAEISSEKPAERLAGHNGDATTVR